MDHLVSLPPDGAVTDRASLDFLKHAVATATSGTQMKDASEYDILCEAHTSDDTKNLKQLEFLTPLKWLKLLASDGVENHTFHLSPKVGVPSRPRRPYHQRHSPTTNRRRSYRESLAGPSVPLPAPTQHGYSEATDGKHSHHSNALIVYKKDPALVGKTREYRSGLENNRSHFIQSVTRPLVRDVRRDESQASVHAGTGAILHGLDRRTRTAFTHRLRSEKLRRRIPMEAPRLHHFLSGASKVKRIWCVGIRPPARIRSSSSARSTSRFALISRGSEKFIHKPTNAPRKIS